MSRLGPNDKVGGKVADLGGRLNMVAREQMMDEKLGVPGTIKGTVEIT